MAVPNPNLQLLVSAASRLTPTCCCPLGTGEAAAVLPSPLGEDPQAGPDLGPPAAGRTTGFAL